MTQRKLLIGSGLLFVLGVALSGCVIVDDNHGECIEVCDTYCDVYCDPWGCWEECWDDCYCEVVEDYHDDDRIDDAPECRRDVDCDEGELCVEGECEEAPPIDEGGTAGFCDVCDESADCLEEGAFCIQLNDDERACTRACGTNSDCPDGFECAEISQVVNDPSQCIPIAVEGLRSCAAMDAPEESQCVLSTDCEEGESCVDGECIDPDAPVTCESHSDCADGRACMTGVCTEVECRDAEDCDEGATCVDARCRVACESDEACGVGHLCDGLGFCAEDPEVECRQDAECAENEFCTQEGVCAEAM